MKKIIFLAILVPALLITTGSPSFAGDKKLDALLNKMQTTYDSTKAYSADFEQHTASANARKPKVAKGKVSFAKPGKMRWDYSTPQKAFITNGKTFWMVQSDRHEVLEMNAAKAFGNRTPMAFLSGMGNLRKEFNAHLKGEKKGVATLRLDLKKPTTQAQYLVVKVDVRTGLARSVKMVDFFGAYNTILFSNYHLDQKFPAGYFAYKPRKGFKIVHPQKALPGSYRKKSR